MQTLADKSDSTGGEETVKRGMGAVQELVVAFCGEWLDEIDE